MATLKIDNDEVRVSDALVIRMADRLWRLGSAARRAAYAERARKRLAAGRRGKSDVAVVILADHPGGG
jgi:hypothetical protein